jgi:hypothetical protein
VRRDLAAFRRQFDQSGAREAFDWLAGWGARPWVELHVDTRNLGEFHREGFIRCYHRLADLMALRSDLAGVYGASWLYQPELSAIPSWRSRGRRRRRAAAAWSACAPIRCRQPSPWPAPPIGGG